MKCAECADKLDRFLDRELTNTEALEVQRQLRNVITGPLFVVNDHVDIALLSGADGVHLGPEDLSVESARKVAGDRLLIGVSASSAAGVQPGADYVGCGAVFATPVKQRKQVIGPAGVAALTRALGIPVFPVRGLRDTHLHPLIDPGLR